MGTSSSSLRPHIERNHLDLYLVIAQKNGWKHTLPGLMSQAQSQAASEASGLQARQDEFNEESFHWALLNFIITDDQVRDLWSFYIHYTQLVPNRSL